jgi:hypothetical protein
VMAFIVSGGVTIPPAPRRSGAVPRQTPSTPAPEQIPGP